MYQKILVALDSSPADQAMIPHITALARVRGLRLLLLHVANGWRHDITIASSSPIPRR